MQLAVLPTKIEVIVSLIFILPVLLHTWNNTFFQLNVVCVHGTYLKHLESIKKNGLNHMERNHVHFARGLLAGDGVISGMYSYELLSLWTNEEML